MRKITFIFCFLITTVSFGQILLEDFEGTPNLDGGFGGLASSTVVSDPEPMGTRGQVARLAVAANAGQPWQGANLFLTPSVTLTTDKTMTIDLYSLIPVQILAKVDSGSGPPSAVEVEHTGSGWETISFTFNVGRDGTGTANGVYPLIAFFPNWNTALAGPGGDFNTPPDATVVHIDNVYQGTYIPPPPPTTNWTGSTNTNWDLGTNWDNGVPMAGDLAVIPNVANQPIASGNITLSEMLIEAGASVTVNGNVTNTGTITVSSGASFIAQTSVSGAVTYERNLSSTNWHYISSPVIGQDVDNFVASSGLQSGGTDVSFCSFDTTVNDWVFYQDGTNNADVLNEGQGYIVNLTAASGDISFTGTMNVGNETIALATTGEGYNLLGNPYPSYIDSNAMLTTNTGLLLSQTIWVWNQSTEGYEVRVSTDNFQIAPGQGFFVQSNGVPGNFTINEGFQNHQGTDTFLRTTDRTEVYLTLSNGTSTKNCRLYYIESATTSFDNGYDGLMFRAFPEPLSIYTHLISNGFGRDFGVQSIPNDYENLVIPIGINAIAGTELIISANSINLPTGIDIYLEDRDADTFTLLSNNSDFIFTPTTDLYGIGRFYLHTSSSTLGLNENVLEPNLQIYTTDYPKELIIKGQLSSNITNAHLYDLQGKVLLSKTLDQTRTTNTLDTSSLSSGLYVVKIEGGNQSKTQKILIK